jgi:CRP/FNR family transcriptional regulator
MFCNLQPQALAEFESIGTQATLPRGAILFREEEPCASVMVLCTGQAKLSCTSREGKTLILKIATPGDVLGLGAALSNSPHEVTAEAIEDVQVKSMRRADFVAFLGRQGEASLHAAQALSAEYKNAFGDVRRLALSPSVAGRLAAILLEWGRATSCGHTDAKGEPEMQFTMALTHEELASFASTSRETITRLLGQFQRDGLLQIHGSTFHLLSPARLEALTA